ncbi:MAG: 4-(cytidine 5'-diphospho)-2-C-methyl-D-erythritol kinase, partial [Acetobacteraceae bacterium]|nr:4-(cytidine 5'-diphospho)-2-C-methyl-D-erythritol kinase [Acetobacteraceae bacterium]
AAALRLLAKANALAMHDPRLMEAARATSADVPVCLDPRPRVMRGIGDILSPPLSLAALPALMINPGVPVLTKDVFARLGLKPGERRAEASEIDAARLKFRDGLITYLASQPNDLEAPAVALQPIIADAIAALARQDGCSLARMSGSGATCIGLFETNEAAQSAARLLQSANPAWWIAPTVLADQRTNASARS